MKPLILNIQAHSPPYAFGPANERPDVYWEKSDGTCLGFWIREWPDLLGEAVLKVCDRYDWEVWQPDFRADQIYSKTLETGVIHRLFPAAERAYYPGIRPQKGIYSEKMLSRLAEVKDTLAGPDKPCGVRMLLVLHGFRVPFYTELLNRFGHRRAWPILLLGHGMCTVPSSELIGWHRPLTYLDLLLEQQTLKKSLRWVDTVSAQCEYAATEVRKVYQGRIERLTMGCDFDFWRPVPDRETRNVLRATIGIPARATVFFASGNYVPLKQFDRLIEAFCEVNTSAECFLLLAGHGDAEQTARLKALMARLEKRGRGALHPYVTGERLRSLYWVSDVYVSTSTAEGSSVAVIKAMACGLPVVTTPVGETWERMRDHAVGKIIPIQQYRRWRRAIEEIVKSGPPPALDLAVARDAYHWPVVAARFIRLCESLLAEPQCVHV